MTDNLHAALIIACAVVGTAILWRYGKMSWGAKRVLFAAGIGLVAGFLVGVVVVPYCLVPYPWVQIWLPVTFGSIGVIGIAAPWRTPFFIAMVGIAVGLSVHFYSILHVDEVTSAAGATSCQPTVARATAWHSFFTGL